MVLCTSSERRCFKFQFDHGHLHFKRLSESFLLWLLIYIYVGPGCQKTKPANLSDMILGTLLRESLFFNVHGCLDMFLEAGVMARSIAIGLAPFVGWLADIKGVAWIQFLGGAMLAITGLEML